MLREATAPLRIGATAPASLVLDRPSVLYRSARVYNAAIWAIHRYHRYREIAANIGHQRRVLDVGCGTGLLARFLCECNTYVGWDLNPHFIAYGRRRGLDVEPVDVSRLHRFPAEFDVIVAIDIEHHIHPHRLPEDERVVRHEPHQGRPKWAPPSLHRWFDRVLGDNDGINDFEQRMAWEPRPEHREREGGHGSPSAPSGPSPCPATLK